MRRDPPSRVELDDETYLRLLTVDDAQAIADAVAESIDHLRPWMPWATEESMDPAFQRARLRRLAEMQQRGEEWDFGLFANGEATLLGTFGLMTRRGPNTLEIGYWLHAGHTNRGHTTRAVAALTEIALRTDGVERVLIYCDEANDRSAAVPRRLGFSLSRVATRAPEAPAETGREMVWTRERNPRE
jgi:RimJ/RimL family protein N-acetyltransferase